MQREVTRSWALFSFDPDPGPAIKKLVFLLTELLERAPKFSTMP